ncbi:CocE/NonD family hydrolase [Dactylosporangium sp. McL0621]|uniref:CocE/NonD family hydrolase n=1 Tax=Dactylosporangium sp. McL0621 TaxID=3415678 RepID=UPI003CEB17C3
MRLDPVGRLLKLPPAVSGRVRVTRGVPIRMRDGANLRADHYAPAIDGEVPTVLVRTPYGRGAPVSILCRAVAQRGFNVLIQSCRGTGDSSGTFEPLLQEREDGLDTLDWLRRQPWYDGRLLTYGPSYVGFVQWALAAEAGDELKAMATIVTASDFGPPTYAGGAFSLDTVLTWSALLEAQRGPRLENAVELLRGQPRLQRGLARVPMAEADRVTVGAEIEFFQRWLAEADPASSYWTQRGHAHRLPHVAAPVLMIGGWYDIFLPWQLADYTALRAAGQQPHLTIGPWHHGSAGLFQHSAAEAVAWFRAHTGGPEQIRDRPVRVHVGGAEGWLELTDWPPPSSTPQRWHLAKSATLTPDDPDLLTPDELGWPTPSPATASRSADPEQALSPAPAQALSPTSAPTLSRASLPNPDESDWPTPTPAPANGMDPDELDWPTPTAFVATPALPDEGDVLDSFVYDPKDPTPALGGPRLIGKIAGRRDNRPLEARSDVLTFTSAPLVEALNVVGPVSAHITVRATTAGRGEDAPAAYFDVFVRLCEVDDQGRSWNICDGLARAATDRDPAAPIHVELWPTAYRFAAGRRIRIQVSGGAHPRFSRNPGTGAPLGHELELRKVRQEILAPSYVLLPVAP